MSKYTKRATNYHATKPKYNAHVDLITRPFSDVSGVMAGFIDAFDLDNALGAQLDVIGLWVGRSRIIRHPIGGGYFSFDTPGLGYGESLWRGPHDPDPGYTVLSDDTYRIILKAKIAINNWDGRNDTLPAILDAATAGSGIKRLQIVDNQDMTISVWVFAKKRILDISRELIAAIRQDYLTVKAAGVWAGGIETPSEGNQFFGFDVENEYIAGFDTGSWGRPL